MVFTFYIFAAVLIWFSFRSLRGGISFLRYVKEELAKGRFSFSPFASVIVPCKGLDEDIDENLSALLQQDYPAYEVIFVVDDQNDPAVQVINDLTNGKGAVVSGSENALSASPRLHGENIGFGLSGTGRQECDVR